MRLRLDFTASVAKDPNRPDLNEDAFQLDSHGHVFALSDGASESYDSKSWAKMLVNKYIENQNFDYEWVEQTQRDYVSTVDFQSLSWSKQLAFDRGSFATLLGMSTIDCTCRIFSIGDCLAAYSKNGKFYDSFPFKHPADFDARPQLLSTVNHLNEFTHNNFFNLDDHQAEWMLEEGDVIFLMTDALGQWFLREADKVENNSIKTLSAISTQDEFQYLILSLRTDRRIKLDDSTVLRFVVDTSEDNDGISNH